MLCTVAHLNRTPDTLRVYVLYVCISIHIQRRLVEGNSEYGGVGRVAVTRERACRAARVPYAIQRMNEKVIMNEKSSWNDSTISSKC